jgi:glucose-1-phosphate adenylyltransferase
MRPIYTHPRFLPGTRAYDCRVDASIVAEGCYLDRCEIRESVVGIRTHIESGTRITRSVLLGADFYEEEMAASAVPLGIGRDVVLDRVIVDKNARIADGVRLVNDSGVDHADGDGFYIRNGIIIVPKGAQVRAGVTA